MSWFAVVVVGGGVAASLLAWWARSAESNAVMSDELQAVPLTRLVDAQEGTDVRLNGRLLELPGEPLEAPLSGRPCAAWFVSVQVTARGGNPRHRGWETIIEEIDAVEFVLKDESGSARVNTARIEVELVPDFEGGTGLFITRTDRLEPFLEARGEKRDEFIYRFKEAILQPGDVVNVRGSVHMENRPCEQPSDYRGAGTGYRVDCASDGVVLVAIDPSSPKRKPFRPIPPPPPPDAEV